MSSASGSGPTLLAVDDDRGVLAVMVAGLEDGGFAVRTAATGPEAIAILEADRGRNLAALITDVELRRHSGWDVGRRARELKPDLPVLYVTGGAPHAWAQRGVPGSVLLLKPFDLDELVETVQRLIAAGRGEE